MKAEISSATWLLETEGQFVFSVFSLFQSKNCMLLEDELRNTTVAIFCFEIFFVSKLAPAFIDLAMPQQYSRKKTYSSRKSILGFKFCTEGFQAATNDHALHLRMETSLQWNFRKKIKRKGWNECRKKSQGNAWYNQKKLYGVPRCFSGIWLVDAAASCDSYR